MSRRRLWKRVLNLKQELDSITSGRSNATTAYNTLSVRLNKLLEEANQVRSDWRTCYGGVWK
jgi:hypothetical protein